MRRLKTMIAGAAIGLSSLALAACDKADGGPTGAANEASAEGSGSLYDALGDANDLSSTARLVKAAGLEKMFEGQGSYTLFAPTDDAIAALPEADRKALESAEGRAQLVALLSQHITPGYVGRTYLDQGLERGKGKVRLASVGSAPIVLRKDGGVLVLGEGADAPKVVGAPIASRNGMIYRIDKVLPAPAAK